MEVFGLVVANNGLRLVEDTDLYTLRITRVFTRWRKEIFLLIVHKKNLYKVFVGDLHLIVDI